MGDAGNFIKKQTGAIFGGGQDSGILGTGQYQAQKYNIDKTAFDPNKDEQAFVSALQARMAGNGPSVAEQQMRQGSDMAANNAFALAASQRGSNPGMALRLAQGSAAQTGQQTNQAAGQLRAAEQLETQNSLGNVLANQREGRMNREQLGVTQQTGMNSVNQAGYEGAAGRRGDLIGGIGSGLMAMSDKNVKTNISSGDDEIKGFLDAISAQKYNYKAGGPQHVSPMAQDLEKTNIGDSMVVDTPQGKAVDYAKGFGAMLAAQANLNKRLEQVEGGGETQHLFGGGFARSMFGGGGGGMNGVARQVGRQQGMGGGMSGISAQMFGGAPQRQGSVAGDKAAFQKPMGPGSGKGASMGASFSGRQRNFAEGGLVDAWNEGQRKLEEMNETLNIKEGDSGHTKAGKGIGGGISKLFGSSGGGASVGKAGAGGMGVSALPMQEGGFVPGRAEVQGDSLQNDKVKAMLSPGEMVIPRTVVQGGPSEIAAFAKALMAKKKGA